MAQILTQIGVIHMLNDECGAIVRLVQRVLNGILVGQGQRLAILDEEANGNGIGAIIAVEFGTSSLLRVHMMSMGGNLGTILHIDGDHAMWRIRAAVVAQALIDAGILLVHILQDNEAIVHVLTGCQQSLAL